MPKKSEKGKGSRKRRNSSRNDRNEPEQGSDAERPVDTGDSVGSNGELEQESSGRRRAPSKKTKNVTKSNRSRDRSVTPHVETAQFEEDDNLVEIEVTGREFQSGGEEGEVETSDEEQDVTFGGSQNNNAQAMDFQTSQSTFDGDNATLDEENEDFDGTLDRSQEEDEPEATECRKAKVKDGAASEDRNERIEARIEQLSNNLIAMQNLMMQQQRQQIQPRGKGISVTVPNNNALLVADQGGSGSMTTIYKDALEFQDKVDKVVDPKLSKRDSSSSEEQVNTSDELMEIDDEANRFISNCIAESQKGATGGQQMQDPQPSTSGYRAQRPMTRGEEMIKEAETAKARMLATSGNDKSPNLVSLKVHSSMMDEDYVVIGANVEDALWKKIQNNEYVDFSKLLAKDRITMEEDHRLELVTRGGLTFFTPVADREGNGGITSFGKWEQAFRVFSNIFTSKFPERATELIQYNHVIYLASLNFQWENVYLYDKEFRLHMSRHPERSWAIILQQAWTLRLKDRVKHEGWSGNDRGGGGELHKQKSREPCRRFNRGKCNFGANRCKFEHKCSYQPCGKFGHGYHICRKRLGTQNNHSPGRSEQKWETKREYQGNSKH